MIKQQKGSIVVDIDVKPNSREAKIEKINDRIKVYVKEPPERGKANFAIIKLFSKLGPCQIVSGLTSKKKKIRIEVMEEDLMKYISSFEED